MNSSTLTEITPGILTLLPLFYIGWSDSVLSPSEIELIHQKLEQANFLTNEEKAYLIKYTDPKNPPSKEIFKYWVEVLKENAHDLAGIKKKSLVELGIEMAISSTDYNADEPWNEPKAVAAIKDIEKAMGLEAESSVKLLLGKIDQSLVEDPSDRSASFDPIKMQSVLDGDKSEVIERVKKLLRDPYFKIDENPNKEHKRQQTLDQVKALAKQGLGSYAFSKEFGGGGRVGDHITVFLSSTIY